MKSTTNTTLQSVKTEYPNAMAILKVSLPDMSIENIYNFTEITGLNDAMKNEKQTNLINNTTTTNNEVDIIWKNLNNGKIDITYACIGYSMDGRPILNQDEFTHLLIQYGFSMSGIWAFYDDFMEINSKVPNSDAPIFMHTVNNTRIVSEIKPLINKKRRKKDN